MGDWRLRLGVVRLWVAMAMVFAEFALGVVCTIAAGVLLVQTFDDIGVFEFCAIAGALAANHMFLDSAFDRLDRVRKAADDE